MPQAAARTLTAARTQTAARTVAARSGALFASGPLNQYISVPDNAVLRSTGPLTIMAWVLPLQRGPYWDTADHAAQEAHPSRMVVSKYDRTSSTGYFAFVRDNPDDFTLSWAMGTGTAEDYFPAASSAPVTINDGKFHHIVTVWDQANAIEYIDGAQFATDAFAGPLAASTVDLWIGADAFYQSHGYYLFNGIISDVVLYAATALTPVQVAAVAAGGQPPSGYTAWWRLNESSGTTAHDSGPNGLNGTLQNGVQWSMPAPAR